jgi:putative DNA primase/helicase
VSTAAEILGKHGITAPTAQGQHSATCPQCSAGRRPEHQKLKVLGVQVDDLGVRWRCNHCEWSGGQFYERRSSSSPFIAEYVYKQADGTPYLKVCKTADKGFPQFHRDADRWVKGKPRGAKVPYRLPQLVAAAADVTVYVVEGEKDADSLAKIGLVATTASEGAKAKWDPALTPWFKGRRVVILVDADAPGRAHGQKIAKALHGVAASVRVVDLFPGRTDGADVSDWLATDSAGVKLLAVVKDAPEWKPESAAGSPAPGEREALISELSRLSELDYQARRTESKERLGIPVGVLDKLVRQARSQGDDEQAALPHWQVEPWSDSVPGGELLDAIQRVYEKYIVLPKGAGVAFALWTLHAWTMDAGDISPFLVLVSPTKRCGKTSALIVLYYLTPRSELASNISASALFRYVEEVRPTLLLDEADSFIKNNEEMRGILDSGHTRTAAHVIRNVEVNGEHKPRRFSTWAPKAIATIRKLADTLEDRSVVVQLQRKPKSASVARLRRRDSVEFEVLRRKAARWVDDNFPKLADPDPAVPNSLNDRAADNWRPLLAIAEVAGGDWPARARDAASVLSGEGHDSTSLNVELLADIRLAFGEQDKEIRSAVLVARLVADPERPWVSWKKGKALTQNQLAGLLRPFGITSEDVHPPDQGHGKGYKRVRFEDAWEAYLPGQNASAHQNPHFDPCKRANADETGTACEKTIRTDRKTTTCPYAMRVCTLARIETLEMAVTVNLTRAPSRPRPLSPHLGRSPRSAPHQRIDALPASACASNATKGRTAPSGNLWLRAGPCGCIPCASGFIGTSRCPPSCAARTVTLAPRRWGRPATAWTTSNDSGRSGYRAGPLRRRPSCAGRGATGRRSEGHPRPGGRDGRLCAAGQEQGSRG